MNPNAIVMTPEQLEVLKAGLLEELRKERSQVTFSSAWEEIKQKVDSEFNVRSSYQMTQGLSAVLRNTLEIRGIKDLRGDMADQAVKLTFEYIDALKALKGD